MSAARSSGDLAADRRYLWAEASLKDRDAQAAADLFRQALDIVPDWPPAWFGLGQALALAQDPDAADAFRRCLALAPDDVLGAGVHLARLEGRSQDMPERYVAGLFDDYAARFDAHLTGALEYRGPAVVAEALATQYARGGRTFRFHEALDLGCGTGLMAEALQGRGGAIDGVDLSAKMLSVAARRGLYRNLVEGEVVAHLAGLETGTRYDLILAADVLVYIGDLAPLFGQVKQRLAEPGLFAFTAQKREGDGFTLGDDLRFAHSARYIAETAAAAGLEVSTLEPVSTRKDAGRAVPGLVVVLSA